MSLVELILVLKKDIIEITKKGCCNIDHLRIYGLFH